VNPQKLKTRVGRGFFVVCGFAGVRVTPPAKTGIADVGFCWWKTQVFSQYVLIVYQ